MKPFDLDKALAGHPIVTRAGIKVIHLWHKCENENLIVYPDGGIQWVNDNGMDLDFVETDYRGNDLFLAPKEETLWVAVKKTKGANSNYSTSKAASSLEDLKETGLFPESDYTYHQITREVE